MGLLTGNVWKGCRIIVDPGKLTKWWIRQADQIVDSGKLTKGRKNCGECQPYYYVNLHSTLRLSPATSWREAREEGRNGQSRHSTNVVSAGSGFGGRCGKMRRPKK